MYEIYNENNSDLLREFKRTRQFDLIYADCMYEDLNFYKWLNHLWRLTKDTGSLFVQTNYKSVAEIKIALDYLFTKDGFRNWIILPFDWGGRSDRYFARKHDDLLWYTRTDEYKFYPERIQIPKVTAGTGFDKNNKPTKLPTDVWDGMARLSTIANEKIRGFPYQKPQSLMERLVLSTTDKGDTILDPFMGTASMGEACIRLGRKYVGIELINDTFQIAKARLERVESGIRLDG